MKAFFLGIPLLVLSVAVQDPVPVRADTDAAVQKQLTDLEFELTRLLTDRDFTTYATYLAEDYVRISANGDVKTKDEVLKEFRANSAGPREMLPEVRKVRVYGDTAVMTIHLTIRDRSTGTATTSLLTKVFVSRGGRWVMVSNQGTSTAK